MVEGGKTVVRKSKYGVEVLKSLNKQQIELALGF
jgi:hypothetical protein